MVFHFHFHFVQITNMLSMALQGHVAEKKQAKRRRSGHRSSSGKFARPEMLVIVVMPLY